uniref:Uncharacterized protein n=1 Tax=Calcidiscus leptoporus TaxID=127549 RepID=A0A7S0IWQ7_9EUKA|mmetsp:Transcript_26962/g.62965  ORF Transcript_26962/g.62965 Transcript_26962/m.62965 type:complete len:107 (+) Transcript_26962:396-716(+)
MYAMVATRHSHTCFHTLITSSGTINLGAVESSSCCCYEDDDDDDATDKRTRARTHPLTDERACTHTRVRVRVRTRLLLLLPPPLRDDGRNTADALACWQMIGPADD